MACTCRRWNSKLGHEGCGCIVKHVQRHRVIGKQRSVVYFHGTKPTDLHLWPRLPSISCADEPRTLEPFGRKLWVTRPLGKHKRSGKRIQTLLRVLPPTSAWKLLTTAPRSKGTSLDIICQLCSIHPDGQPADWDFDRRFADRYNYKGERITCLEPPQLLNYSSSTWSGTDDTCVTSREKDVLYGEYYNPRTRTLERTKLEARTWQGDLWTDDSDWELIERMEREQKKAEKLAALKRERCPSAIRNFPPHLCYEARMR